MALCIWHSISLTIFWTFVRIHWHECTTLRQSGSPVFAVDSCPGNVSEVEAATLRLNCSRVKEVRNVYHCLPLSNLSLLVEFCYEGTSGLIEKGNCMVLDNDNLDNYPCNHFTNGCPNTFYLAKTMFKFPACTQINEQDSCYLADPNCPNISFVEGTTMASVNTNGNNTVLTNDLTPFGIGALAPFFVIGFVILIMWTWERHRCRRRGWKENQDTPADVEINPLLVSIEIKETTENISTELEETSLSMTTEEDAKNELQTYLEDKDFLERYHKYLDEGFVEVCPISQIIILGEHGVGKTTLLYRLQGRSREEIEAIRSTRGVECHIDQHSFIIERNQLRMNVKGINSMSLHPEQISEFAAETMNYEKESTDMTIPESNVQHGVSNAEVEETETKKVENNLSAEVDSEETTGSKIPVLVAEVNGQPTSSNTLDERRQKIDQNKKTDQERESDHDRQSKQDRESDRAALYAIQSFLPMLKEEEKRQGLISEFGNKDGVVLDVLDFAGQGEYYASHQTYIRKNAIFILVVNTSKDFNQGMENHGSEGKKSSSAAIYKNQFLCDRPGVKFECWRPKDYLYYWLNTIRMHGGNSENIIFVGTHKDQRREDFDFDHLLDGTIKEKLIPKQFCKPVIIDLCRDGDEIEEDLNKIKNDICELIVKCEKERRPAKWLIYSKRFDLIKKKFPIIRIEEVLEMIDYYDFGMGDSEIADMLHFFHSAGKIIFFNQDKLQEFLILDIQWFIDCFKYIISDRKYVDENCRIVDSKEKEMLNCFRERGVLEVSLYEKLLNQKRWIPLQYRSTLAEYQNKLGMMFYIKNYKIDDSAIIEEGWYVPSINTQEFKPCITKYESKDSSHILCLKFKDYLPHDLFGRVIVACVNSGNWHPYDFLLCKAGANMCYQHSSMAEGEQVYLFTSKRIVTVQFIGKHSRKNGQTLRQEIVNIVRHICHFYASSTEYEVGFLCRKQEGYKENSVSHFVSKKDKFCQGCKETCHDEWKDAESFWKDESNKERPMSTRRKNDPLRIACDVYSYVVKRSTEIAAKTRTPESIRLETNTIWLDSLVEIGQKLKNLHRNIGGFDGEKEIELRNINIRLKKVSSGLKNVCKDLRKEMFFLWTRNTDMKSQGISEVSLESSREEVKDGTEIILKANTNVAIRNHLWFRKTIHENKYRVLDPSEETEEKFEFQNKEDTLVLKIKNFALHDKGVYYVAVETENGFTVSQESLTSFAVINGRDIRRMEDTSLDEFLLVAALDFGTTYSGIAWSFTKEFEKHPLRINSLQWASMVGPSQATYKTPTALLLNSKKEMLAFGYEAEEQYSELADDNAHSGYYFFRNFMMLLYENETLRNDTVLVDDEGHAMQAKDIFAHSIAYMKGRLLDELNSREKMIGEENIKWVITVPAIWNDAAKQFTREAAVKAGIPRNRIKLALNSEAASIFTKEILFKKSHGSSQKGTRYIVLDLGGGTIDITLKEITDENSVREVHHASGGPWGGLTVNRECMVFLEGLLGKDVIDELKTKHKASWLDLEREIESKKRNTRGDKDGRVLIQIPAELLEIYENKNGKKLINAIDFETKYAGKIDIRRNSLRIDKSIMETFFKKCLDNITKHLKNLLSKPGAQDTKYLVLVGGLAESEFMRNEIAKAFSHFQIFIPDEPWLAVMRGAVMFGQNPSVVKSRISKYTYGVAVVRYFLEDFDDPENKIEEGGKPYCKNAFNKLAEVGQSFEVGETAYTDVYAHRADMTKMKIRIYRSTETNPRYVTDGSCLQIGNLLLDMPGYGSERKVTVFLSFGDEEITCEGVNETGESVHVTLDLLSDP